jgi:hypothetical protein
MAEKILELLGPFGEWLSNYVGQEYVVWAFGALAVGIPGFAWLMVRISLKAFTMSQQWKMRLALSKVIVGLTFAEEDSEGDGQQRLALRTVEETDAKDVMLTEYAVGMLVRSALFVSKRFPFLRFGRADDEWVMLNSFLNLISEKFAFGYIAQVMGLDVIKKAFVIAITCERGEDIKIRKIRLQMVTSKFMGEVMALLQKHQVFAEGHLSSIVSESKSARQAMRRFNDLLDSDEGYDSRFMDFAKAFGLQYKHHRNRVKVMALMAVGYYVVQEKRRLHDTDFKADVLMELEIALPDTNNEHLRTQISELSEKVATITSQLDRMEQMLKVVVAEVAPRVLPDPALPAPSFTPVPRPDVLPERESDGGHPAWGN